MSDAEAVADGTGTGGAGVRLVRVADSGVVGGDATASERIETIAKMSSCRNSA
jgi:hypothetical protein